MTTPFRRVLSKVGGEAPVPRYALGRPSALAAESGIEGLPESEVTARREQGLGNEAPVRTSRSYGQIFRENVFTFINMTIFALGVALVMVGRPTDALVSVGVILVNVNVGVIQEIRAKRTLDRIALLTRPRAIVVREGRERAVDPGEIVAGDVLAIGRGDQIVVDGQVLADGQLDVDESLLTGESDLVPKHVGDQVYSGSYCVSGSGLYEAQKVGTESLANRLTSGARAFRRVLTPLQQEINLMVRMILLVVVYFEILVVISSLLKGIPVAESVRVSTVIAGLVPNGLFLAISAAYAIGALRMVGQGVLVQQANAVESLSNVDVLCLDKTGTLTTNRIKFHALHAFAVSEDEARARLGDFVASVRTANRTSDAIAEACRGHNRRVREEVPFSSARKWSALTFSEEGMWGTCVLGAPEVLRGNLVTGADLGSHGGEWTAKGLRVLLFACCPDPAPLHDEAGNAALPDGMVPVALVGLSDELRKEARETLSAFSQAHVDLKIISGDNAVAVAALARQAGLQNDARVVSGEQLTGMDRAQLEQIALETTVFGRVTPQQKEELVLALRSRGHYVAMIGDGVNDVPALKQANLGVAMQSGSQAARGVADIVLLHDSFAALPRAVGEGQKIIHGMQDILRLFLTRVFYVALLILSIGFIAGYPFGPKQNALLTFFTVGVPSIALAAWAKPGRVRQGSLIRRLLHFVLPATLTLGLAGLGVYIFYLIAIPSYQQVFQPGRMANPSAVFNTVLPVPQSALTTFLVLCGLLLVIFVEPPTEAWVGGDSLSGDWRPTYLVLALLGAYVTILAVPMLRSFFELAALKPTDYLFLTRAVALWGLALMWIWRSRLAERFFNIDLGGE